MKRRESLILAIPLILCALGLPIRAADPPPRDSPKKKVPEIGEMLAAILVNGSNMGPTSGWFHPSQSRYGWNWLSERFDLNKDGVLSSDELKGSARLFRALDRDGGGARPINALGIEHTPTLRARVQIPLQQPKSG